MKFIQCKNHHYYDSEKYDSCPYCSPSALNTEALSDTAEVEDGDKTLSLEFDEEDNTVSYESEILDGDERTIGIYDITGEVDKVTGWLVCVEGRNKGASYRIGFGRNFIGRALDMDISFSEDSGVSRKNHGMIVFDDRTSEFYVVPGAGVIFVDGQPLESAQQLEEDMILGIGEGKYQFIPYCTKRRGWK